MQTSRLAAVSEWAQDTHRRWIIGLLVPPPSEPSLAARVIVQLQTGGVHPTIWNLEGSNRLPPPTKCSPK